MGNSALMQPMNIGKVRIKNRFAMAPMAIGSYISPEGEFTPAGIDYFVRRAQGGFGLLFIGAMACDKEVDPDVRFCANPNKDPGAFRLTSLELNRRAGAYGAKVFAQMTMGLGRNYPGCVAPSSVPTYGMPDLMAPEITVEQIHRKIEIYADTCKLLKDCGYAGVDVHAMHWGYLLDEFANPLTNLRTDEYGGSLENRTRIMKELREAIAKTCGQDFPVTVRLGLRSYLKDVNHGDVTGEHEAGRTVEESIEIAKLLESYGYDGLSVDTGVYESYYYACPPMYIARGYAIDMAARVQEAVSIPVLLGGRMGDASMDEDAVASGKISGVVLGRPSLADPDFPKKTMMAKQEEIRPCIACNQGCLYRLNEAFVDARCAVNPQAGSGMENSIEKALVKKKVVVIGGGVGGMEAARVCALRGHDVSLYEKTGQLGGNLIPAGAHAFKIEIRELNTWYQNQIRKLGVDIHLNAEMDAEKIRALSPDAVVFAIGSNPVMPRVPGIDHPKAVSCTDVLTGKRTLGNKVVVVGGGLVGCEIAYEALLNGKEVTVVEGLPEILSSGAPVPHQSKSFLKEMFEAKAVPVMTGTFLAGINDDGVVVKPAGSDHEQTIAADDVVIAVGFRPLPSFAREVEGCGAEIYEVGDGKQVANILNAVWDAFEVAKNI